jgi:hypothetical protein
MEASLPPCPAYQRGPVEDILQNGFFSAGRKEISMETNNSQHKEQVGFADWAFVAFLILITAIAGTLTLLQIYLQNPK